MRDFCVGLVDGRRFLVEKWMADLAGRVTPPIPLFAAGRAPSAPTDARSPPAALIRGSITCALKTLIGMARRTVGRDLTADEQKGSALDAKVCQSSSMR